MQLTAGEEEEEEREEEEREEEEETPYVDRQTAQAEKNRCQAATNLRFYRAAKKSHKAAGQLKWSWAVIVSDIIFI